MEEKSSDEDKSDSEILNECQRELQELENRKNGKRTRESEDGSEDGFITVQKKSSKRLIRSCSTENMSYMDSNVVVNRNINSNYTTEKEKYEVCLFSQQIMPKQMAFARFLRNECIVNENKKKEETEVITINSSKNKNKNTVRTYSSVVKSTVEVHSVNIQDKENNLNSDATKKSNPTKKKRKKVIKDKIPNTQEETSMDCEDSSSENEDSIDKITEKDEDKEKSRKFNIRDLIWKLKEIFMSEDKFEDKILMVLKTILKRLTNRRIPLLRLNTGPTNKFKPREFWCSSLSKLVAERRLALGNFRRNPTPDNLEILESKVTAVREQLWLAKGCSWRNFCGSIDECTSILDMWNKMQWFKGLRHTQLSVPDDKQKELLRSLTPDSVSNCAPTLISNNDLLETPFILQELESCLKNRDTAPDKHENEHEKGDVISLLILPVLEKCKRCNWK
ncbi:unnamed protein product, partial [Brenthis ino]